jgi:hypothetical protein
MQILMAKLPTPPRFVESPQPRTTQSGSPAEPALRTQPNPIPGPGQTHHRTAHTNLTSTVTGEQLNIVPGLTAPDTMTPIRADPTRVTPPAPPPNQRHPTPPQPKIHQAHRQHHNQIPASPANGREDHHQQHQQDKPADSVSYGSRPRLIRRLPITPTCNQSGRQSPYVLHRGPAPRAPIAGAPNFVAA